MARPAGFFAALRMTKRCGHLASIVTSDPIGANHLPDYAVFPHPVVAASTASTSFGPDSTAGCLRNELDFPFGDAAPRPNGPADQQPAVRLN